METFDLHLIDGTINLTFDNSSSNTTILAQTFEDADIIGQMTDAWYNFIDSGQVWALLIGLFIGYSFKGLTSY
ncbi:hypothetical protein Xen7305DRAFT_00007550 [Xenococcus sp. PCC 7305]|uniref:hypothetical protein n=1 Tax=Xenococcus sp. PCC 7305 TaxID=102125 RepID=UPI0002AC21E2|nr:hypothetical protein [Xenococcus sp. PCC 7305]ELS01054.1 hypothetical protein Xen7305DRAFT_00007550 [Xenococcus sp. PCC 7305]